MKCNISIHDVSPDNLNRINEIVTHLTDKYGITKITLLIIPGLHWNGNQINILKNWQKKDNLEHSIFQSINALAAAMQTTG